MDSRAATADYYDLAPDFPRDIPFYLEQVRSGVTSVLELGCGTGRVSLVLAPRVEVLHGVDLSPAMVERCLNRLRAAGIDPTRASATVGDITRLDLGRRFDLLIAPYRVLQNLTTEAEVAGLFASVRGHLAAGGRCILNTYRPYADPQTLVAKWSLAEEQIDWELPIEGGRVTCSVRRAGATTDPLVLYPDLIYRRYEAAKLVEEAVSHIAMRCWYPEELLNRIRAEGFSITQQWGGYEGEPFGAGPELIVTFTLA